MRKLTWSEGWMILLTLLFSAAMLVLYLRMTQDEGHADYTISTERGGMTIGQYEALPVDINSADLSRLMTLDGIGPELAQRIIASGGAVISELSPDAPPLPYHFPVRNRIISGLSSGVLVVEGRRTSGALITADYALDQSRDVYAVPGSIYASVSEGTNFLIQNGAFPALSPWDILESQHWASREPVKAASKPDVELTEDEKLILDRLQVEPLSFDEIAAATGFSAQALNSHLTMMILRGIIIKTPGNIYRVS